MFSPELMRFLINNNIEEYETEQKKEISFSENKMFRYAKFASIPIEIRK